MRFRGGAVAQWHREALRTNLWLLPTIEVIAAIGLFMVTLRLDRAVYHGRLRPPSWVISGTADAARQILASIAASVITVVGHRLFDHDRDIDAGLDPVRSTHAA